MSKKCSGLPKSKARPRWPQYRTVRLVILGMVAALGILTKAGYRMEVNWDAGTIRVTPGNSGGLP